MAKGEFVSKMEQESEKNPTENKVIETEDYSVDLKHELYIQYRLLRKQWSAFIRTQLKKHFTNILYITAEDLPIDYILSLQKQYPDKIVEVLVPLYTKIKDYEKASLGFEYFLQNNNYEAEIYKIPSGHDNIKIYGAYTDGFSNIEKQSDIYNIKNLAHFAKMARKTALKLKPDIIHSDNIPLMMGLEYSNRWLSGYPIKYIQTAHNINMFKSVEPFWAAINLVNKKEMQKICKDSVIKKNIAALFNIKSTKNFTKLRECLDYLYKNYEKYRENVAINQETNENILLDRLNERILKLFPNSVYKKDKLYNPLFYSFKQAKIRILNSMSEKLPDWAKSLKEYHYLVKKYENTNEYKLKHTYDVTNFREVRQLNNKYLVRELSEKRIETKFVDLNLFTSDEVNVCGYLDSFYKSPLLFVPFNEYSTENDIKIISIAILKLFELKKTIQVIYNFPKGLNNNYLKSLIEFFESQPALNGRWVSIEGNVNIGQFLSGSDMILIPSDNNLNIEKTIYLALKYGCIPVTKRNFISDKIVTDIFDDMNSGCGFKEDKDIKIENPEGKEQIEIEAEKYTNTALKVLNFYNENAMSWNLLIKNAMNSNIGWDFESIEQFNDLYENALI